jgi:hypothetical protein
LPFSIIWNKNSNKKADGIFGPRKFL